MARRRRRAPKSLPSNCPRVSEPHCIVSLAPTISIFADRPVPSDETTVTTSGGSIFSRFVRDGPEHTCSMPWKP
ncbi:hypothetical protein ACVWXO_010772 [Bradyrhizobium sp. LM2.7]